MAARRAAPAGSRLARTLMPDCPLIGGEPVGALTWIYDGERFVDGVFEVACADCSHRCSATTTVPAAMPRGSCPRFCPPKNRWPVPAACPGCVGGGNPVRGDGSRALAYQGKRADRARTTDRVAQYPGFTGTG